MLYTEKSRGEWLAMQIAEECDLVRQVTTFNKHTDPHVNGFERTFQGFQDFTNPSSYLNLHLSLSQYIKHHRLPIHTYLVKVITKGNK